MKQSKKILVVDDDPAAIFITQRMVRELSLGADLLTACHGREALDLIRELCQGEQCLELILLDIRMPVMDGFELLEELQQPADLSGTPFKVVLLSSSTHFLDVARAKGYPILGFLEKPLTAEKLSRFL